MNIKLSRLVLSSLAPAISVYGCDSSKEDGNKVSLKSSPNILVVINDDQSYPWASAYGCSGLSTPGFDFVAANGILFNNAYVTSPGSSPSRASLLTGLYPWQIAEAGTHASSFPSEYPTYVEILEKSGYKVGYTGKGWGPGNWAISGRMSNPAGPAYNSVTCIVPYTGISKTDYAANFAAFLDSMPDNEPFCFWLGANEPHRGYQKDSWKQAGYSIDSVKVPSYLPDVPEVRGDILDYCVEIEWADNHLSRAIEELKSRGKLGNTLIIVLADNGMAFPHAKANCYDDGVHVPMAMCWLQQIPKGQVMDKPVSTIDLFPTILEACEVEYSGNFSGQSLLSYCLGNDTVREEGGTVFFGRERHSSARPDNLGYPIRAVRRGSWLLIHNFHPDRWPAGNPTVLKEDGTPGPEHGAYYDIDSSPTSSYIIRNRETDECRRYYIAGMYFRPEYELYDLSSDPGCMTDLSSDPSVQIIMTELKSALDSKLHQTCDPRVGDNPEIWETYPRLSGTIRHF